MAEASKTGQKEERRASFLDKCIFYFTARKRTRELISYLRKKNEANSVQFEPTPEALTKPIFSIVHESEQLSHLYRD
jgi:hypothetical protein